jgi:WXG100 family type VII secretion target
MEDMYNKSNEGKDGSVKHLSTINFNDTISAYGKYISRFDGIVRGVNSTTNTVVDRWKGKGRDAFEKDCRQVQLNLNDISEIMYDLHQTLIDAHAEYMKTDSALSKSFDS